MLHSSVCSARMYAIAKSVTRANRVHSFLSMHFSWVYQRKEAALYQAACVWYNEAEGGLGARLTWSGIDAF
jgi:hypothetical protein